MVSSICLVRWCLAVATLALQGCCRDDVGERIYRDSLVRVVVPTGWGAEYLRTGGVWLFGPVIGDRAEAYVLVTVHPLESPDGARAMIEACKAELEAAAEGTLRTGRVYVHQRWRDSYEAVVKQGDHETAIVVVPVAGRTLFYTVLVARSVDAHSATIKRILDSLDLLDCP